MSASVQAALLEVATSSCHLRKNDQAGFLSCANGKLWSGKLRRKIIALYEFLLAHRETESWQQDPDF